jgi:hypothetical protein
MNRLLAILFLFPLACFAQRTVLYNSSDFTLYSPSSFWTANSTSISNALSLSVFLTQPEGDALYQPKDATLTALAGASTGTDTLIYFSAADTAAVTTFTSWGRGLVDDADQTAARVTLGLVPGTDVQAYDADLAAYAALGTAGMIARTGAGTVATRTITGDSEITVSNGDGVSGNPTLAIASSITRDSELSVYALLAGPTFTGDPKAPTASANDNDTSIATTAFVEARAQSLQSSNLWQSTNSTLTRLAGIGAGTEGDILYRDSVGWTNLARGSTGKALFSTSSSIAWSNVVSGGGDAYLGNTQTFTSTNTFTAPIIAASITVNDDAYDATGWNGSTNVPTKNAVRDKIESLSTGSGTKTIAVFRPTDAQPPAANFATLDTRNSVAVLDFDDTTDESVVFVGVIPEAAVLTSGITVYIRWTATSATSGAVRWGIRFERMTTDIDSDSFETTDNEANTTTDATSGVPNTTTITATSIDSLAAGDGYRIKIYREPSDTGNDTMSGDAELIVVELRTAN